MREENDERKEMARGTRSSRICYVSEANTMSIETAVIQLYVPANDALEMPRLCRGRIYSLEQRVQKNRIKSEGEVPHRPEPISRLFLSFSD